MLASARANAAMLGIDNAEFCEGYLEDVLVKDESVDLVMANGVLNLRPDKGAVLSEVKRVLKPDGRLHLTDIVVNREVPEDAKCDISLWTGCIAGALSEQELRVELAAAGLVDVAIREQRYDVFSDAPSASSAAEFGTQGVDVRVIKPAGR